MSAFGGLILTNKGRNLQAKAQTGVQLNFTRISVGDGDLAGTSILDLNALKNEVKSLAITKLKTMTGGKAVVGTVFSNETILAGFYWRELGVFAQDPDLGEILYCYGNAGVNAEYIPAGGGPDIIEKSIDVVTIVGNAANVTATIESSLVYTTAQELNDAVDNINISLAAKETPEGAQAKATAAQEAAIAYAVASIAALVNSSPAALDTLNELAAALGNDPNFATTITNVLALKAPLVSPALTGTPTAPTPAVSTNTTQLATTAFVKAVVAALVDSSPAALDTLNELAAALGDDPNFAATMTGLIGDIQTALAVHQADYTLQVPFKLTTGTANTYVVTLSPALTAYVAGVALCVKINLANTGASTINVNGLGAKAVLDSKGSAMTSGKLRLNGVYTMRYDGTNFILQGEGASGNATASDLLSGKTASTDVGDIVGEMPNQPYPMDATNVVPGVAGTGVLWLGMPIGAYLTTGGLGAGKACVQVVDPNFIPVNIKSGKGIFGIVGTGDNLIAGSVTVASMPTERTTTTSGSFVIAKTFIVGRSGTITVSFDGKCTSSQNSTGQLYKNGVAFGISRTMTPTYTTFTEDIEVASGDIITLRHRINNDSMSYVKNLLVMASEAPPVSSMTD